MLKVLIVTGTAASRLVKEAVSRTGIKVDIEVLPRHIAALMSLSYIAKKLKEKRSKDYDCVLLPGMIPGDAALVEKELGIPVFKGPKHAIDLPIVLEALERGEVLSKRVPACVLLEEKVRKAVKEELLKLESNIDHSKAVKVGRRRKIWIGGGAPLRIAAEILDAPLLSLEELVFKARKIVEEGADVVDLGMLSEDPRPYEVKRLIKTIRKTVELPVSIDTLDEEEIREGLKAKIDMVLSLTPYTIKNVKKLLDIEGARNVAYVVVPFEPKEAKVRSAEERVEILTGMVKELRDVGARKIIVDPLVDPPISPGCFEAFATCRLFALKMPHIPLMLGAGNVTELIDADSQGLNALLAVLAMETGVGLLLTTEGSAKTVNCVKELVTAAKMVSLARERQAPPKDLGVDLLILKEKRRKEEDYVRPDGVKVVEAKGEGEPRRDPAGSFKVMVDRRRNLITLLHFKRGEIRPDVIIEGQRAFDLRDTIIRAGLVTDLKHAFYLGYELAKAELALKIGRSYVQDENLL